MILLIYNKQFDYKQTSLMAGLDRNRWIVGIFFAIRFLFIPSLMIIFIFRLNEKLYLMDTTPYFVGGTVFKFLQLQYFSWWSKNRLLHRECAVRVFIHESQNVAKRCKTLQNFRNSLVRYAHSFVSKVLQRVNKICAKHFVLCNLFIIYIRPISCNKPSK